MIRAVTVGTVMIAMSRQRTRQLLIENGEPLRGAGPPAGTGTPPRGGEAGTGRFAGPGGPPKAPAPGPTATHPPWGGLPPPVTGRPEAGVGGPPFPLVIERLRTALHTSQLQGHLDHHRATLPASATKRVGTYNHQSAAHDPAFTGNHP